MYLNMTKFYIQLVLWSFIAFFSFTATIVFIGTTIEYGTPDTIPVFILFTIVTVGLTLNYVKNMVYLGKLKAMDDVFRADSDGLVPVKDVAGYLHITPEKLMRIRLYAERKKILINLIYDAQGDRFILSERHRPNDLVKDRPFVGMSCPGCGASLKIRAGATGVCPYCDRMVTAPNIQVY